MSHTLLPHIIKAATPTQIPSGILHSNESIDFSRPSFQGETTGECPRQCGIYNGTLTPANATDFPSVGTCYEVLSDTSCSRPSTFALTGANAAAAASGNCSSSFTEASPTYSASGSSHNITTHGSHISGSARNSTIASTGKAQVSSTLRAPIAHP